MSVHGRMVACAGKMVVCAGRMVARAGRMVACAGRMVACAGIGWLPVLVGCAWVYWPVYRPISHRPFTLPEEIRFWLELDSGEGKEQ